MSAGKVWFTALMFFFNTAVCYVPTVGADDQSSTATQIHKWETEPSQEDSSSSENIEEGWVLNDTGNFAAIEWVRK